MSVSENQDGENIKSSGSGVDPQGATSDQSSVEETDQEGEGSGEANPENEVAAKIKELEDRYVRAVAELENVRRRSEKEKSDLIKYSLEKIMTDLLPVLDSFEKALPDNTGNDGEEAGSEDGDQEQAFMDGVVMVSRQLVGVLEKHGLERIASAGQPFDPNFHQGIQRLESKEVKVETVCQEFAAGYTLNGRLLRPAMVSVSVPS